MTMEFDNDVPRYRKKSKKNGERKSDHKHEYKNCVLLQRSQSDLIDNKYSIGTYCTICGKIGKYADDDWIEHKVINLRGKNMYSHIWNEDARREFNNKTRTIPLFWIDDFLQKYV